MLVRSRRIGNCLRLDFRIHISILASALPDSATLSSFEIAVDEPRDDGSLQVSRERDLTASVQSASIPRFWSDSVVVERILEPGTARTRAPLAFDPHR